MFIFDKAIRKARTLFDFGIALGFEMNILDLGGGFPGTDRSAMEKVKYYLNFTENILTILYKYIYSYIALSMIFFTYNPTQQVILQQYYVL